MSDDSTQTDLISHYENESDDLIDDDSSNSEQFDCHDSYIHEQDDEDDIVDETSDSTNCQTLSTIRNVRNGDIFEAIAMSVLHNTNPRPLLIYLSSEDDPMNVFFQRWILSDPQLSTVISTEFICWHRFVTSRNFHRLIQSFQDTLGDEIAGIIFSFETQRLPPVFLITILDGQFQLEASINSNESHDTILQKLNQAQQNFQYYRNLNEGFELTFTYIDHEQWNLPRSRLVPLPTTSNDYFAALMCIKNSRIDIIDIQLVQNSVWLEKYVNDATDVTSRLKRSDIMERLFHGCSYDDAESILQRGFDHNQIGKHGVTVGRGFYFTSNFEYADRYAIRHSPSGHKRILICQVIIGEKCAGSSSTREPLPGCDSTTDYNGTYVVYRNSRILPEYLLTYR